MRTGSVKLLPSYGLSRSQHAFSVLDADRFGETVSQRLRVLSQILSVSSMRTGSVKLTAGRRDKLRAVLSVSSMRTGSVKPFGGWCAAP